MFNRFWLIFQHAPWLTVKAVDLAQKWVCELVQSYLVHSLTSVLPSSVRDWNIKLNKFNCSSINSIVQSLTVAAQTFNSHVIKKILDSDWLRGSENYSNRVRVNVWNRMNRTNLRFFCSEDGIFIQTIHNLGTNGPGILLAVVSMVEDGNVNDLFKKEKMSVSTSTVYCAKIHLFK